MPDNQRQHRTLHIQKDVLPYAFRAKREQLKTFKDVYLKAKARIWP